MMENYCLNGAWTVRQEGKSKRIPAAVPGCVHLDLLNAGLIEDPFYRDNETRLQWIGEADWIYERTFRISAGLLQHDRVILRCEGLDTLAEITLNGKRIARTDNMYRTWEFDIKKHLKAGQNRIEVKFNSPIPYINKRNKQRPLPNWCSPHEIQGRAWVRKEPCNFGWDWGPILTTCGIWRDIRIVGFNVARLKEVQILQEHSGRGNVQLEIRSIVDRVSRGKLIARMQVSYQGEVIAEEKAPFQGQEALAKVSIPKAKLWYPQGMGEQPLYEVRVELCEAGATEPLDAACKRIGLRTLRLARRPDKWGESFQFEVNGKPFFAKGANWIPADVFAPRLKFEDYKRLLGDAVAANMNMLRVWGGGIYEEDAFYELCDELGICVWQDFMFSCSTYPTFDRDFMKNVQAEAEDNVRRLRHHPSIALWCGNNELEQGLVGDKWTVAQMSWKDYAPLFDRLLPGVVAKLDPQRDYVPGSPHKPKGDRNNWQDPSCGDCHLWTVWHGRQPFEWYRTSQHRFCSEFGFQSFPEPRTVQSFTEPQDRNVTSYIMEHHQRSRIGNGTILTYMLDWFRLPKDFENTLWLSQILQGIGIQYAVEHWRRNMPRTMGTLYWQLNDCWPVASWSSIDSFGRWKALQYMAKRFYAPLLISGVEDLEKGCVDIYLTSDLQDTVPGEVSWVLTNVEGKRLKANSRSVSISSCRSVKVQRLDFSEELRIYGKRNLMLWLELRSNKISLSSNLVLFSRPKHLELPVPQIKALTRRTQGSDCFEVTLSADQPALWTWLELKGLDAKYSDNFLHLRPGVTRSVTVQPIRQVSLERFRKLLKVKSLVDTY